jgi:hypothetical protein
VNERSGLDPSGKVGIELWSGPIVKDPVTEFRSAADPSHRRSTSGRARASYTRSSKREKVLAHPDGDADPYRPPRVARYRGFGKLPIEWPPTAPRRSSSLPPAGGDSPGSPEADAELSEDDSCARRLIEVNALFNVR